MTLTEVVGGTCPVDHGRTFLEHLLAWFDLVIRATRLHCYVVTMHFPSSLSYFSFFTNLIRVDPAHFPLISFDGCDSEYLFVSSILYPLRRIPSE
jgi:hypothetical protein